MVEWTKFIEALRKVLSFNDEIEKQLRYILDNSNTGFVSMFKFADFLSGFGPIRQCIDKVRKFHSLWKIELTNFSF